MKTKHTSKTLQERLVYLQGLKDSQEEIKAFLTNPGDNKTYDLSLQVRCGGGYRDFNFTISRKAVHDMLESEMRNDQLEIEQILEELGLEE